MKVLLLVTLLLFIGCAEEFTGVDELAIRAVMAEQEKAWDSGDIPGFMRGYADDVCFHSKRGLTCGKAEVTANYVKSYPDKAAMGDLSFGIGELVPAGAHNAWLS
ncbi:MAG TPA: hypothetical protein PK760_01545, partial [Flavobacteriales bacterium]|nr:hypothetical protein [Flavobacteriales bacterium]